MIRTLAAAAITAVTALTVLGTVPSADASTGHHHPTRTNDEGFNVIIGTRVDDTLFGTRDADAIFGRGGNDRLVGNGGGDLLFGNRGDDTLIDNQPSFFGNVVTLRGGLGNDLCIGNTNDRFLNCETVIVL